MWNNTRLALMPHDSGRRQHLESGLDFGDVRRELQVHLLMHVRGEGWYLLGYEHGPVSIKSVASLLETPPRRASFWLRNRKSTNEKLATRATCTMVTTFRHEPHGRLFGRGRS